MSDERAPVRLDYPTPHLSPYDRPVLPVVRLAHRVKIAARVMYLLLALAVVAVAIFGTIYFLS